MLGLKRLNNKKMNLNEAILSGNFEQAAKLFFSKPFEDVSEEIISCAFDKPSLAFYGFTEYLTNKRKEAIYHYLAAELLITALSHIEGATQIAYAHAKKTMELLPDDLSYKEFFLFFHSNPNISVPEKEMYSVVNEILNKNIHHENANKVKKEIDTRVIFQI